ALPVLLQPRHAVYRQAVFQRPTGLQLPARIGRAVSGRLPVYGYPAARGLQPYGMPAPNVWHLYPLHRHQMTATRPICIACWAGLLLALATLPAHAQQRFQRWGGGVDDEPLHFGFSFHYIEADYKIVLKREWQKPYEDVNSSFRADSLYGVYSPFQGGVGLGL